MHHTYTIHTLYKVLSNKVQSSTLEGHRGKKSMYTYSCTVHVWCMCGTLYGACMVHKEQNPRFGNNFSVLYGACMVHVWCMCGALYGACMVHKEQNTSFGNNFSAMYGA